MSFSDTVRERFFLAICYTVLFAGLRCPLAA